MAVYKIFPSKDATLYSQFPNMNTGLDQILEASSYLYLGDRYKSRYLIQFSTTEIQDILNNKVNGSFSANLKNYNALTSGLSIDTSLYFYTVSGSWGMGTGHYGDSPQVTNGTSWNWRTVSGSDAWTLAGGDVYASPVYSQSFAYANPLDISVDVTNTINAWYSESVPNDGFLVKLTSSVEESTNTNIQPIFKYFSIDTHTIYPPYLEFKWSDYSFDTGSSTNTILGTPEAFISIYNNAGVYYSESIPRLRLAAIPKYPDRQFITASYYTQNYYLPESQSLYAIKDSSTNEFVVDFDSNYTRISADATSSYFDVYMNGLEPERYYTVLVKTVVGGVTKVWDENIMFKVEKG
jgi:hypothetical protein